ncbi:MAG: HDOD domain-containing protein [Cellvibrio sp.]
MNSLVSHVNNDIIHAIKTDKLILPTLPEIALRVREAAEDPEISIEHLASLIGNDAALSARIIRVSNNPLMRASQPITDIKSALLRLGIQYTSNIATGLAMQQMFQATSDIIDQRMRDIWNKSSEVAGICYVLCKHYTRLRPDQATLAGLVHKIGVLPILSYAENNQDLLRDSFTLDRVIEELHAPLGNLILKAWRFPESLASIPTDYLNFSRQAPKADLTDLVTVAVINSEENNPQFKDIDFNQVTAFQRLSITSSPNEDEDLSADMVAAMALLN